jgi:tRNA (guanine-N7-)-methyltransferase
MKTIKSFVIRQRTTKAQARAISEMSIKYVLHNSVNNVDVHYLKQFYAVDNPFVIEIGFGMGDATWQIANSNPNINYLAIDVHEAGVGALLLKIKEHEIENLRIINDDAVEVLQKMIKKGSVLGFHIFCPDPWPKRRHWKRRLLQVEFITNLMQYLRDDGYIHIITDHECYKNFIEESIKGAIEQISQKQDDKYIYKLYQDHPYNNRPTTKFEQRALSKGGNIWDFVICKNNMI